MQKSDFSAIDGDLLRTFVTIFREGSISGAARVLEKSQSTLSHRLDRFRELVADPVFVRAGRNIAPTERAKEMLPHARAALEALEHLTTPTVFNPADITDTFLIAATDFERSIFLLDAHKRILREAPNAHIRFLWDRYETAEALRNGQLEAAISPIEEQAHTDIRKRKIFDDQPVVFYDPAMIEAPDTLERFLAGRHVRVMFSDANTSFVDTALQMTGQSRNIVLTSPSIAELPQMMLGTDLVATLPSRLHRTIMRDFAVCKTPYQAQGLTYNLFWHERTHLSPRHVWLRDIIITTAKKLAG